MSNPIPSLLVATMSEAMQGSVSGQFANIWQISIEATSREKFYAALEKRTKLQILQDAIENIRVKGTEEEAVQFFHMMFGSGVAGYYMVVPNHQEVAGVVSIKTLLQGLSLPNNSYVLRQHLSTKGALKPGTPSQLLRETAEAQTADESKATKEGLDTLTKEEVAERERGIQRGIPGSPPFQKDEKLYDAVESAPDPDEDEDEKSPAQ